MNYFYFGYAFQNFILKGVDITSVSGFLCLCFGVASLCVGNEGLRVVRAHLARCTPSTRSAPNPGLCTAARSAQTGPERGCKQLVTVQKILNETERKPRSQCNSRPVHLMFQSLVHMCYVAIGYVVMLVVMTFNAYLLFVAVLGVGAGYFLFGTFNLMLMGKINPYLINKNCGGIGKLVKVGPDLLDAGPCAALTFAPVSAGGDAEPPMHDCGAASGINDAFVDREIFGMNTPETDRQLLMTCADDVNSEEHRTSDIAALLSQEVTVDIHV